MLASADLSERTAAVVLLWRLGPKAGSAAKALQVAERIEPDPDLKRKISLAIASLGNVEENL